MSLTNGSEIRPSLRTGIRPDISGWLEDLDAEHVADGDDVFGRSVHSASSLYCSTGNGAAETTGTRGRQSRRRSCDERIADNGS